MIAKLDQFALELDTLLGLNPGPAPAPDDAAIQTASLLMGLDLDVGAAPRPELRARWISHTRTLNPQRSPRNLLARKWAWAAALLLVLALLIAFRQPVFAAVGRLFGYIYIQDSGFLPADSTFVLAQPVVQSHDGRSLLALRGTGTPRETTLYLEYSDIASPADGAQLETATGDVIPLSWWEYSPNAPDSHGVRLYFPALPEGVTQTTLVLPEGWRLPLDWIPASQSELPDVQVIPYPQVDAVTPSPTDACVEKNGMQLCVLAATTSPEATSILVGAQSTHPDLHPGNIWQGLVWQTETEQVTLRDAHGRTFAMDGMQGDTLIFAPLPGGQQVTLSVPALLTSVGIPEQTIVVDVGADPRPDTVIPLDVSIQILDMTVHFSQATFVGDGVNSLRLTLNADPVQTVNGLTPIMLEMGKPPQVDDLYGSGNLAGSKDLFVELVRPQGKINGVLELPVVNATVAVSGPFEFSFTLPDVIPTTPTPIVADPNTFSPAPTPTPLSLDSYAYNGQSLQSGDLLFAAMNGDNTDIYTYTPGVDSQPRPFVTLPGAVAQVYVHPDRQGLDYLAGSHEFRDGFSYIDHIRLYTLRFIEDRPRLLFSFAPNPINHVGTIIQAAWSFDGKYMAFRDSGGSLPGFSQRFGWFDMSCRASGLCLQHEIPIKEHWSLSAPIFSPSDYRILFSGADDSGTGEPDVFLLDFAPDQPNQPIVNLTTHIFISDGVNTATWTPEGKILDICFDGMSWEINVFCIIDPLTGNVTSGELIYPKLGNYRLYGGLFWLSPTGSQVATTIFPKNGTRDSLQELRLVDLNGHLGPKLAESQWIEYINFSPAGEWLAYVTEEGARLYIADVNTGNSILVQELPQFHISFVGWVR